MLLGRSGTAKVMLFSCYREHNAANKRRCARDGRQRYVVRLVASSANAEQAKHNQDYSQRFIHSILLRRR